MSSGIEVVRANSVFLIFDGIDMFIDPDSELSKGLSYILFTAFVA